MACPSSGQEATLRSDDLWGSVTLSKSNPREDQSLIDHAVDRLMARGFNSFRSEAGASYVRVEGVRK